MKHSDLETREKCFLFFSCLWKDVGDGRDEDISAPDALLDQASQGLAALQPRPAVHHNHAELLVLLEGFAQDVVDERRAGNGKTTFFSPSRCLGSSCVYYIT